MLRIVSCQKLPSPPPSRPTMPRIMAMTTAMPTPAETKFWTVRPAMPAK